MKQIVERLGNAAAVLGIFLCVVAGVARVVGLYHVVGFEAITLYVGGMGLMLMACLAKLHFLSSLAPR